MINQNTQAERTVVVVERWRWDPEAKRWWQTAGLPDLWKGSDGPRPACATIGARLIDP